MTSSQLSLFDAQAQRGALTAPIENIFSKANLRMAANENGEVIYCFSDVLAIITGTSNPRKEMANVKKALEKQGIQLCQIMAQVKFRANDGKLYKMWGSPTRTGALGWKGLMQSGRIP